MICAKKVQESVKLISISRNNSVVQLDKTFNVFFQIISLLTTVTNTRKIFNKFNVSEQD